MPTATTEHLRRDLHPIDVTMSGTVIARGARVFVTDNHLLVYVADDQRNVLMSHRYQLDAERVPRADRGSLYRGASLDLTTADGQQVWLNRSAGCGCGSPLKVMARPDTLDW